MHVTILEVDGFINLKVNVLHFVLIRKKRYVHDTSGSFRFAVSKKYDLKT
jgi:hypothetical protein